MTSKGKSVRMFLLNGTPGGLVTAEIMNWTGHVLAGPRSDISSLLRRPEAGRTGVYVLLGDAPDSVGGTRIYIGEGDDISTRLAAHGREKDFWERAVLVTSKDANLTKAHARYIEARLIKIASEAQRAEITNGTMPPLISLPEADQSDMEYFIAQILVALPVLGVNVFRAPRSVSVEAAQPDSSLPIARFKLTRDGRVAEAEEVAGEFVVLAGSEGRQSATGSGSYAGLRDRLIREGALDITTDPAVFVRDQPFASASAAASVVNGSATNGRKAWIETSTGKTYGERQESLLSSLDSQIIQ